MKRQTYAYFFIFFLLIVFLDTAQADVTIWQIGSLDDSSSEFIYPDTNVIEYQVPQDWQNIIGQPDPNWGKFPSGLFAFTDHEHKPREVGIQFNYPEEYNNPNLTIRATTVSVDPNIYLEIFKGDLFIGKKPIFIPYSRYTFFLGYIQKGIHERNIITIRCRGPSNSPVIFDMLSLSFDDTDSDGDGVSDTDEGDCSQDANSVCIPIRSYDPSMIKTISLYIATQDSVSPVFRDVIFLDPNSLNLPEWIYLHRYSPYGFLGFRIADIGTLDRIYFQISYMNPVYASACFYAYQDANRWEKTDYEFIDGNTVQIFLNDGGVGDSDGAMDGNINTILSLSYPRTLDVNIDNRGCFIKTIYESSERKYESDF